MFLIFALNLMLSLMSAIVLFLFVLKYFANVRRHFFAKMYNLSTTRYFDHLAAQKRRLFSSLTATISADEKLRAKGLIRVLEVGAGPGNNFQFYPSNLQMIVLEPNTYFEEQRKKNLSKSPGIRDVETVVGFGEDMACFESNSIDAVVGTFLHCSVHDVRCVIEEIHRVLVPGGKYYFMEHSCGPRGWVQWRCQRLINPLWGILFDGCNVIRNAAKDIKSSGLFVNVETTVFAAPPTVTSWLRFFLDPVTYGIAQKSHLISNCN